MVSSGDAAAFIDEHGRLCVPDRAARADLTRVVVGPELESMLAHYGVEREDVASLRRRMILEGGWAPEDVAIVNGVIHVPAAADDE